MEHRETREGAPHKPVHLRFAAYISVEPLGLLYMGSVLRRNGFDIEAGGMYGGVEGKRKATAEVLLKRRWKLLCTPAISQR